MGGEAFERQRAENAAILAALERKKEARTMAVPTDDGRVKARLRELGEPICMFGEGVSVRCPVGPGMPSVADDLCWINSLEIEEIV
jgi:hypothetical protein